MPFLIFLFCLLFAKPIFAAPSIQITTFPSSLNSVGATFPVTFTIQDADSGSSYYYKFYGGIGDSNTQIQTSSSLSYTASWSSFNTFTVDTGGSAVVNSYAYIKSDVPSGSYNLYTRIALSTKTTETYSSSASTISVTAPTPTNTPTPTSDPTVTNPSSGISLNEFMPYTSYEWVEIYNDNDFQVKLVDWSIYDSDDVIKSIDSITISANSYYTFDISGYKLNDGGDSVILKNNDGSSVSNFTFPGNKYQSDKSWSYIYGSWCQADMTKGSTNVTSCYTAPTSTPTPTPTTTTVTSTPTPDESKYDDEDTDTEAAIIEPADESSFLEITPTPTPTTTGSILGDISSASTKKNYLPLIFIVGGGLLLTSPVIITQIKKNKNRK